MKNNLFITFLLMNLALLAGCDPKKKTEGNLTPGNTKKTEKTASKSSIDLTGQVYIDRNPSNGDALFRFTTNKEVSCLLEVATILKEKEPLQKIDCSAEDKDPDPIKIKVLVTGLKANEKYTYTLTLWPKGGKKSDGRKFVLKESTGDFSTFGTGGGEEEEEEKKKVNLIVGSFNLGMGVGSIYRHELEGDKSKNELLGMMTIADGCQFGPLPTNPLDKAEEFPRVSGVVTRGFASGVGKPWPHSNQKISLTSPKEYQKGADWEWSFQYGEGSFQFRAPSGATFSKLEMDSGEVRFLNDFFFEQSSNDHLSSRSKKRLTLRPGTNLNFSWEFENAREEDRVNIQVGHGKMKDVVLCSFLAKVGRASIPANVIDKLPVGYHYVTINLESNQVFEFDEPNVPKWALKTQDTRSALVSKQ